MSLLLPSELAAIQAYGESGMTAQVKIFAEVYDTGMDLGDDPYGSIVSYSTTPTSTTTGWLVGHWALTRDSNVGDIDTTTAYRLRLPVGTTISPAWRVEISGVQYHVIDVGSDQTWPEWLTCTVRRIH